MGRHFWILGSSQRKNKWIHSQERNGQIQVTKSSFGQSLEALRCWCRRSFGLWRICSGHALDSYQVGRLWSTWRFTWTFNPSLQKKVRSHLLFWDFRKLGLLSSDEFENILGSNAVQKVESKKAMGPCPDRPNSDEANI